MVNNLPKTFACEEEFNKLCNRIDDLEAFVEIVTKNMNTLEEHVKQAEEDLGVNDRGIKGLLKPIFGKAKNVTEASQNPDKIYVPLEIFKTSDYFPNSNSTYDDSNE